MPTRLPLTALASLASAAALLGSARGAAAQDFATQSPGALSRSHAGLEGQDRCNACHDGGRELSREKCLGCHTAQAARIRLGRGLHASPVVGKRTCWTCHFEHRGRDHDAMGWPALGGRDRFDHAVTSWPLRGVHAVTACDRCHRRRDRAGLRVYLGEKATCESCHAAAAPHGFPRGQPVACARCHSETAWKPAAMASFDHDRDTAFVLEGSHEDVACAKCHPRSLFKLGDRAGDCARCHRSPHDGHLFGRKKCELCHSPAFRSLRTFRFDHARETRFPLDGKHRQAACAACHPKDVVRVPRRECEGCHARDSRHGERFAEFGRPPACKTCHPGATRWKPAAFDHQKQTAFALTGKHARVACRACHRGSRPDVFERFDAKTVGCRGCHSHENVHDRKFSDAECLSCHRASGVMRANQDARERFHGPRSRFPLALAHARVACDGCHQQDRWKGLSRECGPACHADTLHRGTLGADCARCHTGGTWDATGFSHDRDSSFPLRGMHRQVRCQDCHPHQQFVPRPTRCGGCHRDDDVHRGALGPDCGQCHRETGALVFDHNRQAAFKLEDRHVDVACASCHPTLAFVPRPTACAGCHPEPAVHRGRYGTACAGCHSTRGWKGIRALHDVGNFSLGGSHDRVPCERCHRGGRKLGGQGNQCIVCHREDDIHANSLGPRCGDCHTQWSFAPARFDHVSVGCDLQGLHRTTPCFDCHKAGNFGALTSQCYGCHRDQVVGDGIHVGAGFFSCGDCHNINYWQRPNTAPAMTSSVCR
ncbi:MAG TPA: hypothetical protein VKB80_19875 [Kofleriaceae bacterium]|nr:hypothetical protein [Kofleriaceae bacterium]